MKRTFKWALTGSIVVVTFCGGFLFGVVSHYGDPIVRVDVMNHSKTPIRTVTISHEHGTATTGGIGPGTTKRLDFFALGETSFRTTVEFENGRQMEGKEMYAKAGYRITMTVSENEIDEQYALYGRTRCPAA